MGIGELNVGQLLPLKMTLKKAVATAAIAGTLGLALFMSSVGTAVSGSESRTISMVHQHTGERITITYMQSGRYVPSAMKKINYFLRDWRRNEVITIDPKTIDLIWEMHADLGSKQPIHIVCGYRSPKTNAFLKRIGRKVAKKSQHMKGAAIDFFFPDVSSQKIRNSALARGVGGVGYYRSAGGPTGFIHADSGNVRHWGPAISRSQLASIISQGRKSIGRRGGRPGVFDNAPETSVAGIETKSSKKSRGLLGWFRGDSEQQDEPEIQSPAVADTPEPALESIYNAEGDELADLSADASAASAAEAKALLKKKPAKLVTPVAPVIDDQPAFVEAAPAPKLIEPTVANKDRGALAALAGTAATEQQAEKRPTPVAQVASVASLFGNVPKPRLKPRTVLALADAKATEDVVVQPVSAEPEQTWAKKSNRPSPIAAKLAKLEADDAMVSDEVASADVADGKSNLATDLRDQSADELVVIQPVMATTTDPSWLSSLYASAEASLRRDGVQPAASALGSMPVAAVLGPDGSGEIEIAAPIAAEGKGDLLTVNREGKTGLPPMKLRLSSK
jgi:uncharacterized protein YcbK (DUF882 family)